MATASHHRFSFRDYVDLVEERNMKMEWLDGQIFAMSGGTVDHARIAANVSRLLGNALDGKPCAVFSPDLRVRSKVTGLGTYADVTVICGQPDLDPEDPKGHTVSNPHLLVEVLSPSTEDYDRGDKLRHYQTIPALREVMLVGTEKREIEVIRRGPDGSWSRHLYTDVADLTSLGCTLSLDDVYRDPLSK
jgi:Uma2 family endonuclease